MINDKAQNQVISMFSDDMLDNLLEREFSGIERKNIADSYEKNTKFRLAFKWYLSASNLGNADATYKVGLYYELGINVKRNLVRAYIWYNKAADLGHLGCLKKLAEEYYCGSEHCQKDIEKAKYYWLRVFFNKPSPDNIAPLDNYFPGWKKSDMKEYSILRYKREKDLVRFANLGITVAAYFLGSNLLGKTMSDDFKKILDYKTDKDKARRWLLKAAIDDYPLAIKDLQTSYNIDATEGSTPKEMFDCSCKYNNKTSEQEKDLYYYWLSKAVEHGYNDACNNLGVCYTDAIGTECDYEKANEMYFRAIAFNENVAAYYNYGSNLYYGNGIDKDIVKAKKYMLISRMKGFSSAATFLKDKFGIDKSLGFEFDEVEDTVIFDNSDVWIEFCGIKTYEEKIEIELWVSNSSNIEYQLWIKNLEINGVRVESFKIVGNFAHESRFAKVSFSHTLSIDDILEFNIQIDNSDGIKICETNRLKIVVDKREMKPVFEIIGELQSPSLNVVHFKDVFFGESKILSNDDFQMIFDGMKVIGSIVYICVLSKTNTYPSKKINIEYISVDGSLMHYDYYPHNNYISPNEEWHCTYFPFYHIDLERYHWFEFSAKIVDLEETIIGISRRIKVGVDFSDGFIYTRFCDENRQKSGRKKGYEERALVSDIPISNDVFSLYSSQFDEDADYLFSMDPEDMAGYIRKGGMRLFKDYEGDVLFNMSPFETSVSIRNNIRRAMKYL